MDRIELAAQLTALAREEQVALLTHHASLVDRRLAYALKTLFDSTESGDPARASAAASALATMVNLVDDPEVHALAVWTAGMAAMMEGRMEFAIAHLNDAETRYLHQDQPAMAAATQVSKLYALAVLGRYDEALTAGLQARTVFVANGDVLACGKIEQNLGNIYFRREQYHEAAALYSSARERFVAVQDQKQLVQIDNCLATTLTAQHRFLEAAELLQQALLRAEAAGFTVTQAEIECNLGCLWLSQGRFDRALRYLESSRRRYLTLGASHDSAIAEQELADAYLEMNLAEEAATMYARVVPLFDELGMRAEQARALAYHGRASLMLGRHNEARTLLHVARTLYVAEGNTIGEAMVRLSEAQILLVEGDAAAAEAAAMQAEVPLADAGATGRVMMARWLRAEAARVQGKAQQAATLLATMPQEAERQRIPQVAYRCQTSLGLLALAQGNTSDAARAFRQAVAVIEDMRAPLPGDDFRTAFLADKLKPYTELVRLCLQEGSAHSILEAFDYAERAKSRALVDMLSDALPMRGHPRDAFEAELVQRLIDQRAELNALYHQLDRFGEGESSRGRGFIIPLEKTVREHEATLLELERQLRQSAGGSEVQIDPVAIADLQRALGSDTTLVEYFSLDGEVLAFVVTDTRVEVIRDLADEAQVAAALEQLRFQLDAFQYGTSALSTFLPQLTERTRRTLADLYELLFRPVLPHVNTQRLVVVAYQMLHYVPFHALHDGRSYVIEHYELCYAPSAGTLLHCLNAPRSVFQQAVLLGIADEQMPGVQREVAALAPLFPNSIVLLNDQATVEALREHASTADVLHLACHGQFRPDNPLFSALRLGNGWFTVYDAYTLDLHCDIVALSACETGMNTVAPGDELIGLARGFFAAGARALLVSLWTADDAATAQVMNVFYTRLVAGDTPAAALRHAQRVLLAELEHPFFWAPFVLLGRW